MNDYTLPLTSDALTLSNAGGKGRNLGRLQQIEGDFTVPDGFVLTTAAYDAFVATNELDHRLVALAAETDVDDPASFSRASAAIGDLFAAGRLDPALAEAITDACAALAGTDVPVAVRSSATAEDLPEASFAGQQDTFLNVRGAEAVLDAVRRCWASLWTARAIAYRRRRDIDPRGVSLAVVVQEMVPATAAGVLFTVNPVSGREDQVLINAAWGLGEALVSGHVNPDTVVAAKATGAVIRHEIAAKEVQTAAVAQGTATAPVAAARQTAAVLTAAQVEHLTGAARQIEEHFGAPQDVEWALVDQALYVLQARPVTTAVGVPGDDDWPPFFGEPQPYDLWTQADVGERWPDPVTPFTWSTWEPLISDSMAETFRPLGEERFDAIQWSRRVYGRIYLNEGALVWATHEAFGMPASLIAAALTNAGAVPEERLRWQWGRLLRTMPHTLRMMRRYEKVIGAMESHFPAIDRQVDRFMERNLDGLSDRELWAEARGPWRERMVAMMNEHAVITSVSMMNYSMMESALKRWTGDAGRLHDLVGGLSDVIAAEIVPALFEMAGTLRRHGLAHVVLDQSAGEALAQLRSLPEAAPFREQLAAFLRRHGHRCATEAEWRFPRWIEEPSQVVATLTGYLAREEPFDAAALEEKARQRREEATAEIETAIGPLSRGYFRWALRRLQTLVRLRDNGQHYVVKLVLPMRRLYAELAARWAGRGWLSTADDFWFLVVEEIQQVLARGEPGELDLVRIAGERRQAHDYWQTQPLFENLDAQGDPLLTEPEEEGQLSGIPASAGVVRGTARVVLSPEEANGLAPGEILVTRATDPGWTPVFAVVGGVVLEIGGQLSHGAIVAREYGLPAVINVPGATRHIPNGATITVDGTRGLVTLEEE